MHTEHSEFWILKDKYFLSFKKKKIFWILSRQVTKKNKTTTDFRSLQELNTTPKANLTDVQR